MLSLEKIPRVHQVRITYSAVIMSSSFSAEFYVCFTFEFDWRLVILDFIYKSAPTYIPT